MGEDEAIQELENRISEINNHLDGFGGKVSPAFESPSGVGSGWSHSNQAELSRETCREMYSRWRTEAEPLIRRFLPERYDNFVDEVESVRRILALNVDAPRKHWEYSEYESYIVSTVADHEAMLEAIPGRVKSDRLVSPQHLTASIVTDELERARNMREDGHLRAAGVIAGVALEEQLVAICKATDTAYKAKDSIRELSKKLLDAGHIEQDEKSLLDHYSDLRNKCAHFDEKDEPAKEEIDRLIDGAQGFIDDNSGK